MINSNFLYEKYHKGSKIQTKVISFNDFTYRNILNAINAYIPKNGRVLDIGSATGTLSFYLSSKGLWVDGVELSKTAVKSANLSKKLLKFNKIKFFNSSFENFKTNKKYKLVLCFEVLEHLENDLLVLETIRKYMIKDSILAISVPSINSPLYKLGLLNRFDSEVGHLRRYSSRSIKTLLVKAGFETVKEFKTESFLRNLLYTNKILGMCIKLMRFNLLNNTFSYLDERLTSLFGESQLILISRKK